MGTGGANNSGQARRTLPTDTRDGMLLIISGPSGVGKTSITRGVERSIADSVFSVSATTRPKTDADVEGVDYHFVTDAEFERMRAAREFLESAEVFGRKYGTPRRWVEEQLARGRLVILEIDVQGARQVKGAMPEAFGLFVLPPGEEALLERLRARKREPEEAIQRRFAEARREIAEARASGVYDRFIVNDDLPSAIGEAVEAVRAERARRSESRNPR
ncbi:MAG: guanylate kinase [Phycisphaerales bacterium]|nr:guanylate kinase [Phycisphaerales bacterium]